MASGYISEYLEGKDYPWREPEKMSHFRQYLESIFAAAHPDLAKYKTLRIIKKDNSLSTDEKIAMKRNVSMIKKGLLDEAYAAMIADDGPPALQ